MTRWCEIERKILRTLFRVWWSWYSVFLKASQHHEIKTGNCFHWMHLKKIKIKQNSKNDSDRSKTPELNIFTQKESTWTKNRSKPKKASYKIHWKLKNNLSGLLLFMLWFRHKLTSGEGFVSIVFAFKAAWGKTIFLSSASTLLCLTLPWRHSPRQPERLTKINSEMLRGRHDALLVLCPSVTSCSELWFTLQTQGDVGPVDCWHLSVFPVLCDRRQRDLGCFLHRLTALHVGFYGRETEATI